MSPSLRRLVLLLAVLLAAAAQAAEESAPLLEMTSAEGAPASALAPARSLEDFDGAWVRTDQASDDAAREEALLAATEAMSFVLRGPTRLYMRRTMVPADRYVFEVDGRRLSIERQPGEKTAFDLDAPVEGATVTFEQGVVRRDWTFDESTQGTTTWTLSEDGTRMAVRRRIRNAMLGGPAVYTTHYVRER